jgi:uncharacterized membrane protein YgcG
MRTLIVGFALVLSAAPAFAQSNSDERWTPWLGCWDLVLENAREGTPSIDNTRELPRTKSSDAVRPRVCVERAPTGGATFRTTIGNQSAITQTLVADGSDRPITDSDCVGTQRAEWSRNGLRLFVRAEMTCKGEQAARRVSGFAMLGPNGTWTDIQAIDLAGHESYRVRRYRRADAPPVTAPGAQGAALSLDDVKEASGKISSHALEAVLVETHASFPLSSRRLIELADAKVPDSVIDLMVALSYPKRFVVETARVDRAPAIIDNDPFLFGFGYPIWPDAFGFYSPFYGYYSPYYYSPFAYSYAYGYNPFYYNGGFAVIDAGGGGGSIGRPDRPSGAGRVVDGLGYTRVRPRESEPTTASRQGSGPIAGGESGSSSSSSSSSGSSGASSVSSGGFSSGASSSDTGRTAQPR